MHVQQCNIYTTYFRSEASKIEESSVPLSPDQGILSTHIWSLTCSPKPIHYSWKLDLPTSTDFQIQDPQGFLYIAKRACCPCLSFPSRPSHPFNCTHDDKTFKKQKLKKVLVKKKVPFDSWPGLACLSAATKSNGISVNEIKSKPSFHRPEYMGSLLFRWATSIWFVVASGLLSSVHKFCVASSLIKHCPVVVRAQVLNSNKTHNSSQGFQTQQYLLRLAGYSIRLVPLTWPGNPPIWPNLDKSVQLPPMILTHVAGLNHIWIWTKSAGQLHLHGPVPWPDSVEPSKWAAHGLAWPNTQIDFFFSYDLLFNTCTWW